MLRGLRLYRTSFLIPVQPTEVKTAVKLIHYLLYLLFVQLCMLHILPLSTCIKLPFFAKSSFFLLLMLLGVTAWMSQDKHQVTQPRPQVYHDISRVSHNHNLLTWSKYQAGISVSIDIFNQEGHLIMLCSSNMGPTPFFSALKYLMNSALLLAINANVVSR